MSHQYKVLSREDQELLLSTFLIDSWSYSKVNTFSRNQIVFEMESIFGLYGKSSSSNIAGKGYHKAMDYFFSQYKEGVLVALPDLETTAFEEIGAVPANRWKLSKTLPTMEEVVNDALKDVGKFLRNFYGEKGIYTDEIEEVLSVEIYFDEFLTVNGVDIPLPCHGKIDLVIRTKEGKIVIIDHKTKASYTDEKEAALIIGQQAITYVLGYEAKFGIKVDEVWFIENKSSQNKNGTPQLKLIPVEINENSRKIFELLLYENLREMIAAVRDPDHVYTINTADNFVDMAEIFDFWTRRQICEVEDFNVNDGKKELVSKRLRKIRNSDTQMINPDIIKKFREKAAAFIQYDLSVTNMTPQQKIEHTLKTFGILAQVAHMFEGYSSNTFLLEVSAGTKVASIFKYRLDIANALDVENVRISPNLVRHEGKSYLSVEISKKREGVLLYNPDDRRGLKFPLGKDNYGNVIYWDTESPTTPYMLACGAAGSGKSVFLFSVVENAIDAHFDNIIILDPKYEFGHLMGGTVDVLSDIEQIEVAMARIVAHMNDLIKRGRKEKTLIIFDEFADAVANSRKGKALEGEKSLEENFRLLLQKGRSSGFRVVAATQRASVKVITGDAKANFSILVCFRVPKEADSRVVLDEAGAESLQGMGDGLIKSPDYNDTIRFQAYYKPQNQPA
jgi:hypothetical protein